MESVVINRACPYGCEGLKYRWKKINEEFPPEGLTVMFYYKDDRGRNMILCGHYDEEDGIYLYCSWEDKEVYNKLITHWTYRLEPPE